MEPITITEFIRVLREHFVKWVDPSLIDDLENALVLHKFDKAFAIASTLPKRVPEKAQTDTFYQGIKLLQEETKSPKPFQRIPSSRSKSRSAKGGEPPISKGLENKIQTSDDDQYAVIRYYLTALYKGIRDESATHLNIVHSLNSSIPCHRELSNISRLVENLIDRSKQTKEHDVSDYLKILTRGMRDLQERDLRSLQRMDRRCVYYEEFKEIATEAKSLLARITDNENYICIISKGIKQLDFGVCQNDEECLLEILYDEAESKDQRRLQDIASAVEKLNAALQTRSMTVWACLSWITSVALKLRNLPQTGDCDIPSISETAAFTPEDRILYISAFDSLAHCAQDVGGIYYQLHKQQEMVQYQQTEAYNRMTFEGKGRISLVAVRNDNEVFKKRVESLNEVVAVLKREITSLNEKNIHLEKLVKTCEETVEHPLKLFTSKRNYVQEKLDDDTAILQKKLNETKERHENLKKQMERRNTERKKINKKLSDSERKCEVLEKRNEELFLETTYLKTELQTLRDNRQFGHSDYRRVQARVTELEMTTKRLESDLEQSETFRREMTEMESISILKRQIEEQEQKLRQVMIERNDFEQRVIKEQQKNDYFDAKIKLVEKENNDLVGRFAAGKQNENQIRTLGLKLEQSVREKEKLTESDRIFKAEVKQIESDLHRVRKQRDDYFKRNTELNEMVEQLRQNVQKEKEHKGEVWKRHQDETQNAQQREVIIARLTKQKEELTNSHEKSKQMEADLKRLQIERDDYYNRNEELKDLVEQLKRELQTEQAVRGTAWNRHQNETQNVHKLEGVFAQLKRKNEELTRSKNESSEEAKEMEADLKRIRRERDDYFKRLQDEAKLVQQLQGSVARLKEQNYELSTKLTETQKYAETVEQLKAQLASIENENLFYCKLFVLHIALSRQQHDNTNVKELEARIRQLENGKKGNGQRVFRKWLTESQKYEKTIEQLEAKLTAVENEKKEMQNGSLSRQHHDRNKAKEWEDKVRQLEREKQDSMAKRSEATQHHEKTIEQLEAKLTSVENEKWQLQSGASSRQHHDKTNMEELEGKIRQLELEKQDMTKRLTESRENETTIKQLEAKLTAVENEKKQMQNSSVSRQHHDRNKAKEWEDKVRQLEREKQEIIAKSSEATQYHERTIEQLEAKLASAENEKWQLQSGQKYDRSKTKELEERVRQLEMEKKEIVKSRDELERRLAESEQMLQSALSQQDNLQKQLEVEEIKRQQLQQTSASRANEDSIHKLKKQLDAREREVHNLKQEVKKIKGEKDDLQNRFSKVAAAQLTHENPNIADLSDKHRPTKLGEIYSELYDNEWTEAFSQIEGSSSTALEEGIVKRLMDILVSSYDHCETVSNTQINGLKALLFSPSTESLKIFVRQDLSAEQSRAVVDLRKQTSNAAIEAIKKEITSKHPDSRRYPALKAYIEKCAELCWLMIVQSPPVYIDDKCKPGDRFDKDVFKAYTRSGPTIDFVVWPPIYLHQGGPLLCKGTAQGR